MIAPFTPFNLTLKRRQNKLKILNFTYKPQTNILDASNGTISPDMTYQYLMILQESTSKSRSDGLGVWWRLLLGHFHAGRVWPPDLGRDRSMCKYWVNFERIRSSNILCIHNTSINWLTFDETKITEKQDNVYMPVSEFLALPASDPSLPPKSS